MPSFFRSCMKRLETACSRLDDRSILFAILFLAATLRGVRASLTTVVNADTVVYLYQAKALYYGMWSAVNDCTIKHITLHPAATALVYAVTGDWILSARVVSIFFGTLMIVPIYFLARLSFGQRTSGLVTLLYAVMHVFVSVSVDIGRDSAYWFFSACGLYFFAAGMKRENLWYFPLASIFFSLATWNRIEAVLYLVVTTLYLVFKKTEGKNKKLLGYVAPILIGFGALIFIQLLSSSTVYWYRFDAIQDRLMTALASYQDLRAHLIPMIQKPPEGFHFQFFENVRTLLWLLGLGVVIENAAEAFFYPFFVLFLVGFFDFNKWRSSEHTGYFFALIASGFTLLYVFVFNTWSMENRYLTLLILPSIPFLGFGVERALSFLQRRWGLKEFTAAMVMVCLILVLALPKELHWHERDKKVYKEIGTLIATAEGSAKTIEVLAIGISLPWVFLYSNLDVPAISCHEKSYLSGVPLATLVGNRYADILKTVDTHRIRYIVWEERHWPSRDYDLLTQYNPLDFRIVGEWYHKDTGRMVLFKRL
jgi:4-amino-4-deoxy-L-arabinose transferase-like glycosyltransferase